MLIRETGINMTLKKASTKSSSQGLSLMGVLIAGFMIIVAGVSLAGLAQRSGITTRQAKDRHVATLLAREGIELVRSLRDDNWIASDACAANPDSCDIYWRGLTTGTVDEQRRAICNNEAGRPAEWLIDPDYCGAACTIGAPSLFDGGGGVNNGRLYLTPAGAYTHDPTGNSETNYRRTILIETANSGSTACSGCAGVNEDDCDEFYDLLDGPGGSHGTQPPDPLRITSTVYWEPRNGPERNVVLVEDVYAWMKVKTEN